MQRLALSKRACFLFVAGVASLLAAGCGGSGSSGDSTGAQEGGGKEITVQTGSLSKAQFIKRADEICETTEEKMQRELGQFVHGNPSIPPSEEEAKAKEFVDASLAPDYEKEVEQLGSLGAPQSDVKAVAPIVKGIQQFAQEAREKPLKLLRAHDPYGETRLAAERYGFTSCAGTR